MRLGNKAFSLTELMVVLVVIALLFSAMAPIVTKRHISETYGAESIWNFVTGDSERNSYFDPGDESWTSSVYVGMVPSTSNKKAGKLVINSGDITYNGATYKQPQMQFRFSSDFNQQGRGLNAATLFLDDSNIVFGTSIPSLSGKESTIYGLSNLTKTSKVNGTTIIGSDAMGSALITDNDKDQYITAVGNKAAFKFGTSGSDKVTGIFIGSQAGSGLADVDDAPDANIAIGYKSVSQSGFQGSHNVFLGAYTGNGFNDANSSYNTIVSSVFSGTNSAYNTIIGYGVYNEGDAQIHNMTAIGYGACGSVQGNNFGKRICLGYSSAQSSNNTPSSFNTDNGEHIFLGGKPQSKYTRGFAGRSVLEVHNNIIGDESYGNVVINSNLVIRGNFFPSDDNGNVVSNQFSDTMTEGYEPAYYKCTSDYYRDILVYRASNSAYPYVCSGISTALPKSVNLLKFKQNCASSGGYPAGGGCPDIVSSDIRLKTDISENNAGLDKILQLQPYLYSYKSDETNEIHAGVIAQHLQKIFPNAVAKDKDGYLKIRWDDMFYALLNAIKELASKVDTAASKIKTIKSRISAASVQQNSIKKQLAELDKRINKLERK